MRETAEVLGVSERQGWRLLAAYRKEGADALAHGNRGRVPWNATPVAMRQQVMSMAQECYSGHQSYPLPHRHSVREGSRTFEQERQVVFDLHGIQIFPIAASMGGDDPVAAADFDSPRISIQSQFTEAILYRHRVAVVIEDHQPQTRKLYGVSGREDRVLPYIATLKTLRDILLRMYVCFPHSILRGHGG